MIGLHTRRDFLRQGGRFFPLALGATFTRPLNSYPQESAVVGDDYFTGQPLRIGNELQVLMDETLIEDSGTCSGYWRSRKSIRETRS